MSGACRLIECRCGSIYERREVRLPIKDIGVFECNDCGARLEIWSGRTVPVLTQIHAAPAAAKRA